MQVLKFGGSSVANAENINRVIAIVKKKIKRDKTAVVASAISGATDALIQIGKRAQLQDDSYILQIEALYQRHIELIKDLIPEEDSAPIKSECKELFGKLREICNGVYLLKELSPLSLDHIMSFGEILSTKIISSKLKSLNISHVWKDSRSLIKTEISAGANVIKKEETENNIEKYFNSAQNNLYILPGFIASDDQGRTTTLGRGGSDYTASILAVGTQARVLEIWTDVNGMMTADPRIVPEAKPIRNISYKEALELSHFGAKVVYPPTIQPVVKQGIPIYVKNTFDPEDGGTIIEKNPPEGIGKIRGISSSDKIALLSMEGSGMVGVPGYSSRLFDVLSQNNINIILITQASSVHTMCIAIPESDAAKAKKAADELFAYEISLGKVDPLKVEKGFSIISLVGDDLKNQSGASGRMFDALGREGINIRAIAQGSSEKNVSTVLHTEDVKAAIRAIHKEFFSGKGRRINLFFAGCGTVGSALIDMINRQHDFISDQLGKDLVICGLADSKNYITARDGVKIAAEKKENKNTKELSKYDIKKILAAGEKNSGSNYMEKICDLNLSNSIFVDCTSSKSIAGTYVDLFHHKIAVATCNKIANSLSCDSYKELFDVARTEGTKYKYETTVGAALPVISTVKQIVNSGDKIRKIEGILSGTLNYLLSNYNGKDFSALVEKARRLGYTEPDPRTDLSGTDVLRKFLILSREAGYTLEMKDLNYTPFFEGKYEAQLKKLYDDATKSGKKLRFVAKLNEAPAAKSIHAVTSRKQSCNISIGIDAVGAQHPFYNVEGSDNAIILTSDYYPQGILIRGAGAGARQTASGLFNDILSI
ncbi:MAG: bifunctional aspartate kinase/homoserine dehydrogenase I [Bacteroidales bacterium]|nr:bifunctional aspartate kinase/homoserine dehydrogenase I [Bacteroidales bacterium]